MGAILANLFGSYSAPTYRAVQELSDGTLVNVDIIPPGLAGVDIPWVAGVFLFGLTLYCLLRIVGSVISNI